MTPLKRLGVSFFVYGLGSIVNRVLSFLLLPLFTRYLSPEDYGITAMQGMLSIVLCNLFNFGLGSSLGIYYFDPKYNKKTTISTAFITLLSAGFLCLLVSSFFTKEISFLIFGSTKYHYYAWITILSALIGNAVQPFVLWFRFEEKAKLYTILSNINMLIVMGLSILAVVVFKLGVKGYLEAYLISQSLYALILFFTSFKVLHFKFSWSTEVARGLLKTGIPQIPTVLSSFIIFNTSKTILQYKSGLELTGIYSMGHNFGAIMMVFVESFLTAWVPFAYTFNEKLEEGRKIFAQAFNYYIIGFGCLTTGCFIMAKPVVHLMTDPKFHDAYIIIGWIALAYFISGIYHIFATESFLARDVNNIPVIKFVSALLTVVVSFILIHYFSIIGAAFGLVFSQTCLAILQQFYNHYRKQDFIAVQYDFNKIIPHCLLYFVFIALSQIDFKLNLFYELVMSSISSILLIGLLFIVLKQHEKEQFFKYLQTKFKSAQLEK